MKQKCTKLNSLQSWQRARLRKNYTSRLVVHEALVCPACPWFITPLLRWPTSATLKTTSHGTTQPAHGTTQPAHGTTQPARGTTRPKLTARHSRNSRHDTAETHGTTQPKLTARHSRNSRHDAAETHGTTQPKLTAEVEFPGGRSKTDLRYRACMIITTAALKYQSTPKRLHSFCDTENTSLSVFLFNRN